MIILRLQRAFVSPFFIMGNLWVPNKATALCQTLERSNVDPEHPAIPEGNYVVTEFQSPHNGRCLLLHDVPGRSMIEVHSANYPEELLGCIAVGQQSDLTKGFVRNSRETLHTLLEAVQSVPKPHPDQIYARLVVNDAKANTATPYSV